MVLNISHDIPCLSECLCLHQSDKLTLQHSARLISVFTYQAISLIEYMNMHNNPNERSHGWSFTSYTWIQTSSQATHKWSSFLLVYLPPSKFSLSLFAFMLRVRFPFFIFKIFLLWKTTTTTIKKKPAHTKKQINITVASVFLVKWLS